MQVWGGALQVFASNSICSAVPIAGMSASGGKKSLLKAAKEALAAKSYRDALTHCKAVLAEDKGCYDAFV